MSEGYFFHFIDPVDLTAVARGVTELFGVPRSAILVRTWENDRFVTVGNEVDGVPSVLIERNPPMDGDYVSFSAGEEFIALTGNLPELQVASRLCRSVRARAILAAIGVVSDALWMFVAPDGSSGMVVVDLYDLDEGLFTVTGAVQRIPGAPEIPVVEPPAGLTPKVGGIVTGDHEFRELCTAFVQGRITGLEFEGEFLKLWRRCRDLGGQTSAHVDRLFTDVDAFCGDLDLREEGDLDEEGLRAAATHFLRETSRLPGGR